MHCSGRDEELEACRVELTETQLRCSREAIERNRDVQKFKDVVQQSAQQRQANVKLQSERDALRQRLEEKCSELRVLESDHEAASLVMSDTIDSLASDIQARDQQLASSQQQVRAQAQTIAGHVHRVASLESVVDERGRTIDSISARLQQLTAQCAQLESDKAQLNQRCQTLENELMRLRINELDNAILRSKIQLIQQESDRRCESATRMSEVVTRQVAVESEARVNALLREHAVEKRVIQENAETRLAALLEENAVLRANRDLQMGFFGQR